MTRWSKCSTLLAWTLSYNVWYKMHGNFSHWFCDWLTIKSFVHSDVIWSRLSELALKKDYILVLAPENQKESYITEVQALKDLFGNEAWQLLLLTKTFQEVVYLNEPIRAFFSKKTPLARRSQCMSSRRTKSMSKQFQCKKQAVSQDIQPIFLSIVPRKAKLFVCWILSLFN